MKIVLVITDGVGVRNFIHGRFLGVLKQNAIETHIITSVPLIDLLSSFPLATYRLHIYKESRFSSFFRKVAELVHIFRHKTFGMVYNFSQIRLRSFSLFSIRTLFAIFIARLFVFFRIFELPGKISEFLISRNIQKKNYSILLKDINPDLVFFSHQRPPQLAPLAIAAKMLNIPIVAFIFSWDNLTSKGRTPVTFDHYLVWSELMKKELKVMYSRIPERNIHVSGTPQFETYVYDDYGFTKHFFFTILGLSPNYSGKLIAYSCGDKTTSPYDEHYISILADWMVENNNYNNLFLIVRTSPAEGFERFEQLKLKYPFIYWNYPDWPIADKHHPETWSQRVPSSDDIQFLKSLLKYADVNINVSSTMTLDFAIFNKPVINVAFGKPYGENSTFDDRIYFSFDHYKKVLDSGAVYVAENKSELLSCLSEALSSPHLKSNGRKKIIDLQISKELYNTSERITHIFKQILSEKIS